MVDMIVPPAVASLDYYLLLLLLVLRLNMLCCLLSGLGSKLGPTPPPPLWLFQKVFYQLHYIGLALGVKIYYSLCACECVCECLRVRESRRNLHPSKWLQHQLLVHLSILNIIPIPTTSQTTLLDQLSLSD